MDKVTFVPPGIPLSRTLSGLGYRSKRTSSFIQYKFPLARNASMQSSVQIASSSILMSRSEAFTNISESNRSDDDKSALLVVDHGSKRQAANDMLLDVAEMIREKTSIPVYSAHMELASPSIEDGIRLCYEHGITHVIVVPFFLSPGRHSTEDIPNLAADVASKFEGLTYEVRPPIGTHPRIVDVVLDRAGLL